MSPGDGHRRARPAGIRPLVALFAAGRFGAAQERRLRPRRGLYRGLLWPAMIMMLLLGTGFGPYLTTSDLAGYRLSHEQALRLAATLSGPAPSASAAILYDVDADQILYEHRAHERHAPASTTKMVTAFVVLQRAALEQTVTVGSEVEVEGMRIGLSAGDRATIEKLLYALLMNSGNDAAMALAVAVGGTSTQFVLWMNELAATLGLTDTHFVNPHGLDAPDHYSSAYDLMVLARAAMQNPIFADIVATSQTAFDGWTFTNTNELLDVYPGADGVKTGTTDEAGQCLVASATRGGHRVILVVLNAQDRYADATTLLDFYYEHYVWKQLDLPANQLTALEPTEEGSRRYLALDQHAERLLPRWQLPWLRAEWTVDSATLSGYAQFRAGETPLGQIPLIVKVL
jgi:D-alanyl-D-alanine carboxypeptidase